MTKDSGLGGILGMSAPYFFLSYAHSDPLTAGPSEDPSQPQDADELVGRFFEDLTAAVRRYASRQSDFTAGFCDRNIPKGTDWKQILNRFLGAAQAFVPLYSPGYLARSRPGRELACFARRVELAGQAPVRRLVPVLWTPLLDNQDPPGLRKALEIGNPDYTENGLRVLLKIKAYHHSYQTVVNVLAKQIVSLAEDAPIDPSEVPAIDEFKSEFLPQPRLSLFTIQTVAHSTATAAPDHGEHGYGSDSTTWRPFPGQELPLAEYARQVAERFDFEAEVTGIEQQPAKRQRRPGIMLIDPWFIADETGRAKLAKAIDGLPPWVLPLVVISRTDDERAGELATRVRDMLVQADVVPTKAGRDAADGVKSLDDFVAIIPLLVAQAERQYFRYGTGQPLSREVPKQSRPVLRFLSQSDEPTTTPQSPGETSDAG